MKGRIHHHHASCISYTYLFVKCISLVLMLYIHLDSTNSFYLEIFISIIFIWYLQQTMNRLYPIWYTLCYSLLYYPMTYMILVSYRFDLNFSLINIWRVLFWNVTFTESTPVCEQKVHYKRFTITVYKRFDIQRL